MGYRMSRKMETMNKNNSSHLGEGKRNDEDDSCSCSSSSSLSDSSLGSSVISSVGRRDESLPELRSSVSTTPPIASKETTAVNAGKLLVIVVLLLAAGTMGFLTYWFTSNDERETFNVAFHSFAEEILNSANSNAEKTISIIKSVSTATTSYAHRAQLPWPFLTIPDYERLAQEALNVTGAEAILFTPLVSDIDKDDWYNYSSRHYQHWAQNGGRKFIDRDGVTVPGLDGTTASYDEGNVSAPLWQYAPAPTSAEWVNSDLFEAYPWYRRLAGGVRTVRHALLSEVVNVTGIVPAGEDRIRSVTVHPVFQSFQDKAPVRGFLSAILPWDRYFSHVLPTGTPRVDVEVKDTCGSAFTYTVDGPVATFVGHGLLHDPAFHGRQVTSDFAVFARYDDIVSPSNGGWDNAADDDSTSSSSSSRNIGCNYTLSIYPTNEFKVYYETDRPVIYTTIVLLVFLFTATVFLLYDWLVRRRQAIVMTTAARTTAIVASMFPKNVQKRVLEEAEQQAAVEKEIARARRGGFGGRAPKSELKEFLGGGQSSPAAGHANKGKPIADLFPETTVLFADLQGFTAWSSTREPAQVFQLLEALFRAFDEIANQRRVFKVETVGDCYVAVAGLPDPRKDHAVVMARYSRDILSKFLSVTKELEVELGPDTGDLMLRCGLHSGPVTAGVLRGQRARFQLFGDTMNTASRMESTGEANKVQISQETADLLIASDKEHWLDPRKDPVHAKGKGYLNTFWLVLSGSRAKSTVSGTPSLEGLDQQEETEASAADAAAADAAAAEAASFMSEKLNRLVRWNAEVLMSLIREIAARRQSSKRGGGSGLRGSSNKVYNNVGSVYAQPEGVTVLEEVKEIVDLPHFKQQGGEICDPKTVEMHPNVENQLLGYVSAIASMYRDNPFHNFEHASHVTMSVVKLLSRIVAPDLSQEEQQQGMHGRDLAATLHDHTYGITSDPLTQFACVFSALIHDVDHSGVPNSQVLKENPTLSAYYKDRSVAEQNSVDIAWDMLMDEHYQDLRLAICSTQQEQQRFRQLVVNSVMATDIMDKELKALRNARWEKAFSPSGTIETRRESPKNTIDRKATIVIEHLIQASDVSHTMQHWHIYRKWNERLFQEMYKAYADGRAESDPSKTWYKGEIGFFDFYIIPLAKKLKDCGVFGVSSDEYLRYAQQNRAEWEQRGQEVVEAYKETVCQKYKGKLCPSPERSRSSLKRKNSKELPEMAQPR